MDMQFSAAATLVRVTVPDANALLDEVRKRLLRAEGFAVATLNLDHLVKMAGSKEFTQAYACHELIVADGWPVVGVLRLAGNSVRLTPGSDLVLPLCKLAQATGTRVALVGGTNETLDRASDALCDAVPGLDICARIAPSQGFDPYGPEAANILCDLDRTGARMVLLALGAPKQERLAARGRDLYPALGFVSIGAGLDFLAGHQRRAPVWMRRIGMEWLWRILQSPGRMVPRYTRCLLILPRLTLSALQARWRPVR